jgi:hypothetical protein
MERPRLGQEAAGQAVLKAPKRWFPEPELPEEAPRAEREELPRVVPKAPRRWLPEVAVEEEQAIPQAHTAAWQTRRLSIQPPSEWACRTSRRILMMQRFARRILRRIEPIQRPWPDPEARGLRRPPTAE